MSYIFEVKTIETTGAGDTFMACVIDAVLGSGLDSFDEQSLYEMIEFANGHRPSSRPERTRFK